MKRSLIWWPLLALAWDFLFWSEAPGINFFLFTILLMAVLLYRFPKSRSRREVRFTGLLTLLSAIMVVVHGSSWSLVAAIVSLALFAVLVAEEKVKTFYIAVVQSIANLFVWPFALAAERKQQNSGKVKFRRFGFYLRVILLPLLITGVFLILYSSGNPHFGKLFDGFFKWLDQVMDAMSILHMLFFGWGLFTIGWLLFHFKSRIEKYDQQSDEMVRVRKIKSVFSGMIALRNELKTGMVLLVLLNLLLLTVNYFDLRRVWIDFVVPENFSLKKFVHEGTWILMFSILLSMLVLLWIFRGNMHFFKENKTLKLLSYCWIGQNIFLVFSLFKRNYEYIAWHGLAYGRIVVVFFLIACLLGLILFWIKIKKDKSVFYMLRIHSFAVYLMIVFAGLINWGKLIVNFNLNHPNAAQIDVSFYLQTGNGALPLLYENESVIRKQIEAHAHNPVHWIAYENFAEFECARNNFKWHFIWNQKELSWLSWNLDDAEALKFFQYK